MSINKDWPTFQSAAKGLTAHQTAKVVNRYRWGYDCRGCGKKYIHGLVKKLDDATWVRIINALKARKRS